MPPEPLSPTTFLRELPEGRFVRALDMPGMASSARAALARGHRAGGVVRVSRGLYFKGHMTRYGMVRPSSEQVALEVLGRQGVGPAGVSAMRAFGLTTQVPARSHLAVTGHRTLPHGLKNHIHLVERRNPARLDLDYMEIAALEALRGWRQWSERGWNGLVTAVGDACTAGSIRMVAVAGAVEGEGSVAVVDDFTRLVAAMTVQPDML